MRSGMTRRTAIKTAALATTALIAAPYVRGAHAAGKLSIGFWDHWVPGANKTSAAISHEWAEKEKVEVKIDYITVAGLQEPAHHRGRSAGASGHDILAFPTWWPQDQAREALSRSTTSWTTLIKQNGDGQRHRRVSRQGQRQVARACRRRIGSQIKGPCSRIDLMKQHAGIDVQAMYPAGSAPKADSWTLGHLPEGRRSLPQGRQSRSASASARRRNSVDTAGAFFQSFGAELVDAKGNIKVKSDTVRQALEY